MFDAAVCRSLADNAADRAARLLNRNGFASTYIARVVLYHRNPDVVAERLHRADGICGGCGQPAPFRRANDGSPYLEVHHILPLAFGGRDDIENTVALCPNCHRQKHYG